MEQIIDDTQHNPCCHRGSTSVAARNFNLPLIARVQTPDLNAQLPGSCPNALRCENENAWWREYLDSPGVNFSKLGRYAPSKCVPDFLVAVCDNDLINQHVVPTFEVVNANFRIFSDCRRLNYPSVRGLVSDRLAELVVRRFARLGLQHYCLARSEVGHGAEIFGRGGRGFSCSSASRRHRGGRRGCLPVSHQTHEGGSKRDTKE